jgi:hypothetical protein
MTHLTRDELVAWRDRPDQALRERVVAHLAVCDACSAMCAELVRTRPAEVVPVRFAPADFAPRAYSLQSRRTFGDARLGRLVPLGIAALLAIMVLVPLLRDRPAAPASTAAPRGGAIGQLRPSGEVEAPTDLSWESSFPAYNYRVEVKDSRGVVLLSRSVASRRIEASADIWRRFRLDEPYSWTVTALDSSGEPMATSEPHTFTIRQPR